mmetsp:Transcript_51901/g.150796  ORF Transcript_51901/g.150796 Transcript_51901/m.150796 type:complete len:370 (+) Transcript_51901:657-1766(+)
MTIKAPPWAWMKIKLRVDWSVAWVWRGILGKPVWDTCPLIATSTSSRLQTYVRAAGNSTDCSVSGMVSQTDEGPCLAESALAVPRSSNCCRRCNWSIEARHTRETSSSPREITSIPSSSVLGGTTEPSATAKRMPMRNPSPSVLTMPLNACLQSTMNKSACTDLPFMSSVLGSWTTGLSISSTRVDNEASLNRSASIRGMQSQNCFPFMLDPMSASSRSLLSRILLLSAAIQQAASLAIRRSAHDAAFCAASALCASYTALHVECCERSSINNTTVLTRVRITQALLMLLATTALPTKLKTLSRKHKRNGCTRTPLKSKVAVTKKKASWSPGDSFHKVSQESSAWKTQITLSKTCGGIATKYKTNAATS